MSGFALSEEWKRDATARFATLGGIVSELLLSLGEIDTSSPHGFTHPISAPNPNLSCSDGSDQRKNRECSIFAIDGTFDKTSMTGIYELVNLR